MAIAEDASSPVAVNVTGSSNPTTASFTPPAGTLLVAMVASGGNGFATNTCGSFTVSDSLTLTWTKQVELNSAANNQAGQVQVWTAWSSGSSAMTVTATGGTNYNSGCNLVVKVLTGASQTQTGATATKNNQSTSSTNFQASITTTTTNSRVYGALIDWSNASHVVVSSGTTFINDYQDSTDTVEMIGLKASSDTGTPGATSIGGSSSPHSDFGGTVVYEVLPAAPFMPSHSEMVDLGVSPNYGPQQTVPRSVR